MGKYAAGETLYVIRTGMPDLINQRVQVIGDGRQEGMIEVECVGDWVFPHGLKIADVSEKNLSRQRKPGT